MSEYIRPTKVWAFFKGKDIRISGEAKAKILEMLDNKVGETLNTVIDKLPKLAKGEHKGDLKRKTIMLRDLE